MSRRRKTQSYSPRQQRAIADARMARYHQRFRQGVVGKDAGLDQITFWMPLEVSDVEAFKRMAAARLPGVEVEVHHPGLDKQEPPDVAATEGSTTTPLLEQESRGRSTQCAS